MIFQSLVTEEGQDVSCIITQSCPPTWQQERCQVTWHVTGVYAKILKAWAKIGFVPCSWKCLYDKKVQHELGQADVNVDLENLHENYVQLVATAEGEGLNPGVFDASIPLANNLDQPVDEDDQVRHLLAQKGAFSASSALWNVCGTRIGNARVVIQAQREQIAIDGAKVTLQTQGRME
jgi:hypothetical protein